MDVQILEMAERQAKVCKIFGNSTRILILWVLDGREMSVSDIAEAIETSLQNTSQHLRLMKDRGILASRRKGHSVYYRINGHELMQGCPILHQAMQDPLHNDDFIPSSSERISQEEY
jgi:DNA-binding transcriptional ArsR family regulator